MGFERVFRLPFKLMTSLMMDNDSHDVVSPVRCYGTARI